MSTDAHKDLAGLGWGDLGRFKAAGRFPDDYPADTLTFYSPRDPGVHEVILWTLLQARHSIVVNMYGLDDDDAVELIVEATRNEDLYVQLNLDSTQAGGVHERELLQKFNHDEIGNSVAIGRSIHGAISHLKVLIVDGLYLVDGSTNWSESGERKQDNQLTLSRERPRCAEARAIADLNHDAMLQQMRAKSARGRLVR
jgi:phosphatidylserine/phosphatidylglycerophosphate/cardiolipin synthase-like enzyme